jgi:hypothetical protein
LDARLKAAKAAEAKLHRLRDEQRVPSERRPNGSPAASRRLPRSVSRPVARIRARWRTSNSARPANKIQYAKRCKRGCWRTDRVCLWKP